MHRTRSLFLLTLAASLFALGGCQSTTPLPGLDYDPPRVSVVGVHLLEQTDEGVRLAVTLQSENPNSVALPLVSAEYTVSLASIGSVTLEDNPNRTLPASGVQQVLLTAAIATNGATVSGSAYAVKGRLNYEPPGEVRRLLTESYVPLPSSEFSSTGTLTASP